MADEKKYINLRFPKNGRYPTYIDILSLYPACGISNSSNDSIWERYNLYDVDFRETLFDFSGESTNSLKPIVAEIVKGETPPLQILGAKDQIDNSELNQIVLFSRSSVDSKYLTFIRNWISGKYFPDKVSVNGRGAEDSEGYIHAEVSGSNFNRNDLIYQYSNEKLRQFGITNQNFSSVVYYTKEALSGYSANRCFISLVNPNEFTSGASIFNGAVLKYDESVLPVEAIHIDMENYIDIAYYVISLPLGFTGININGPRELEPNVITASAKGFGVKPNSNYTESVNLSSDYTLDLVLYNDKVEISRCTVHLGNNVDPKFELLNAFSNIDNFVNANYRIVIELYNSSLLTQLEIPIKINQPFDTYTIKAVDSNDTQITQLQVKSQTSINPGSLRLALYGSNIYVSEDLTDINDTDNFNILCIAHMKDDTDVLCTNVSYIPNEKYATVNLNLSSFNTSSWFNIRSLEFKLLTNDKVELSSTTLLLADSSSVVQYKLSVNRTEPIRIINRNTVEPDKLIASLIGILASGNEMEVTSYRHYLNVFMYNVDGFQIGNRITRRTYDATPNITVDMKNMTIETEAVWNWFEVESVTFQLEGLNLATGFIEKVIEFVPDPDESCHLDYDIIPDVEYIECDENGKLKDDEISVSLNYYIDDVYFPITVNGHILNIGLYTDEESEFPVNQTRIDISDDNVINEDGDLYMNIKLSDLFNDDFTRINLVKFTIRKIRDGMSYTVSKATNLEIRHMSTVEENTETINNDNLGTLENDDIEDEP